MTSVRVKSAFSPQDLGNYTLHKKYCLLQKSNEKPFGTWNILLILNRKYMFPAALPDKKTDVPYIWLSIGKTTYADLTLPRWTCSAQECTGHISLTTFAVTKNHPVQQQHKIILVGQDEVTMYFLWSLQTLRSKVRQVSEFHLNSNFMVNVCQGALQSSWLFHAFVWILINNTQL